MGPQVSTLPDLRRVSPLPRPPSDLPARSLRLALALTHGCLARPREPFADEPQALACEQLRYDTDDGWRCFLHRCPPAPGARGEPVILAHGLSLNRRSLDYGPTCSALLSLRAAGFDTYLLEHRADRSALPPRRPRPFDADSIAARDLPAAIEAVLAHSGYRRLAWIGHGLGGQLLYMHLAMDPHAPIFAAACLGSAVRFRAPRSTARSAELVARLLPSRSGLPGRQVLRLLSPFATSTAHWTRGATNGETRGPLLRGLMNHAGSDLHGGMVRQVARWISSGALCDRHDRLDYLEALAGHPLPLLAVASPGDAICPPQAASPVLRAMGGGSDKRLLVTESACGHLDLLCGEDTGKQVWPAVTDWLDRYRQRAR